MVKIANSGALQLCNLDEGREGWSRMKEGGEQGRKRMRRR
jgi:hypothetical protein